MVWSRLSNGTFHFRPRSWSESTLKWLYCGHEFSWIDLDMTWPWLKQSRSYPYHRHYIVRSDIHMNDLVLKCQWCHWSNHGGDKVKLQSCQMTMHETWSDLKWNIVIAMPIQVLSIMLWPWYWPWYGLAMMMNWNDSPKDHERIVLRKSKGPCIVGKGQITVCPLRFLRAPAKLVIITTSYKVRYKVKYLYNFWLPMHRVSKMYIIKNAYYIYLPSIGYRQ